MATRNPVGKKAAKRAAKRPAAARPAVAAGSREAPSKPAAKRTAAAKAPARKPPAAKAAAAKRPRAARPAAAPRGPATVQRSKAPKTFRTDAPVAAFLERVADPARRADCVALNRLLSQATGAPPRMWGASIVGFGQYRHRYSNGTEGDWPVCGYSPRKQDLTVYVMAGFDRFPQIMARLGRYKTGKSCLYLRALADIDADVLCELIAASNEQLKRMYG